LLVGAELSVLLASASHVKREWYQLFLLEDPVLSTTFTPRRAIALDLPQSLRDATNTMGCLAADPQGDFAVLALGLCVSVTPSLIEALLPLLTAFSIDASALSRLSSRTYYSSVRWSFEIGRSRGSSTEFSFQS
jgi:hypothetical protein